MHVHIWKKLAVHIFMATMCIKTFWYTPIEVPGGNFPTQQTKRILFLPLPHPSRLRAARIDDFPQALLELHKQFHWPLPVASPSATPITIAAPTSFRPHGHSFHSTRRREWMDHQPLQGRNELSQLPSRPQPLSDTKSDTGSETGSEAGSGWEHGFESAS